MSTLLEREREREREGGRTTEGIILRDTSSNCSRSQLSRELVTNAHS